MHHTLADDTDTERRRRLLDPRRLLWIARSFILVAIHRLPGPMGPLL